MAGGRIAFRSDTRHPIVDRIFSGGFKCWLPNAPKTTAESYRGRKDMTAGDIDSNYAVCLSQRASAAALFPFGNKITENSWMYMVFVPAGEEFSTHNKQIEDGFIRAQLGPKNAAAAWWPLYAHEIAVREVKPENIMAVVYCDRSQPISFTLRGVIMENSRCTVSADYLNPGIGFLRGEVALGNQMRAQRGSGFHDKNWVP